MAQQIRVSKDPWQELLAHQGIRQVEINEVMAGLSIEKRTVQELKKALMARVTRLTQTG